MNFCKILILYLALLFAQFSIGIAENSDKKDIQTARKFFKNAALRAHPLPSKNFKDFPAVPLAEERSLSIFVNSNVIETDGDNMPQNESSIAVNPLNPNQLIGSSVDYRAESSTWVYYSSDGGENWVNYNLGKPFANWRSTNDPSVAYDPEGNAYLVYGGFGYRDDTSHAVPFGENAVFISISTDGGENWETENTHIPVILHRGTQTIDSCFEDKYYISIDHSSESPYLNHLYIPWKRIVPRDSSTQIVISKSTDKGGTWSEPVPVSPRKPGTSQDTAFGQSFPLVATGPEGEVYLAWNDGIEDGIGFAKSCNGSKTWSEPRIIFNYNSLGVAKNLTTEDDEYEVWNHVLKNTFRVETYPVIVCDTTESERRGWIYTTWAADVVPNIYFSRSTDGGENWSEPKIIHSDTTKDQFWQWMAVDPMNGDLAVMYLDSRNDSANIMVDCYVSYSTDGGENWTDRRASDVASDLRRNPFANNSFAGDYSGMAFYDGKVYPSWVDMRNSVKIINDNDVYTSLINVRSPNPVKDFEAETIPEEPDKIRLSWTPPTERVFRQSLSEEDFSYMIKVGEREIEIQSGVSEYIVEGLTSYERYKCEITVAAGEDSSIARVDSAYAGGSRYPAPPKISSVNKVIGLRASISVELPRFRDDKVTPLLNLDKVNIYDRRSGLLESNDISVSDTGSTVNLTYDADASGYYEIYATVSDGANPSNESETSDTVVVFLGEIYKGVSDNFDVFEKRYLVKGDWARTSEFSYEGDYSLTDSPDEDYKKLIESFCQAYPVKSEKNEQVVVSFWHAALIQKRDSGVVEYSTDDGESWQRAASFNKSDYSYWDDDVLDERDWKYEEIELPKNIKDTVIVRFNLETNLGFSNDGWYIDNLLIYNSPVSVEQEIASEEDIILYPNPAAEKLSVYLPPSILEGSLKFTITNSIGKDLEINSRISRNGAEFDTRNLPAGIYFLIISRDSKVVATKKFFKLK